MWWCSSWRRIVVTTNSSLLILWSLHLNNNPHLTWALQRKPKSKREKWVGMRAYCTWIISNSWKLMTSTLIYHIQVVLFNSWSQYVPSHTIFNLFACMIGWCKWGFIGSHFPQCVCRHCMGCSQHPKIECPKLVKVNLKLITKGTFTFQIFFNIAIGRDFILHGFSHKFKQLPFGHSLLNYMCIT
jgi:hypothetical protein